MSEEEDKPEKFDLRNPEVVTKYRAAGDISTGAIQAVMALVKPGARVVALCDAADNFILDATKKMYNKGQMQKGIAFPACVSVNNIVGHVSPLANDEAVLAEGDVVKIDVGTHLDGYIAVAANTVVVGADGISKGPITGPKGNVLLAAHTAADAAFKLLKPGNKNTQITEAIELVSKTFHVNAVQGVLSHQMARFVVDGEKVIINRQEKEQKVEEITFAANEVYAIDIVMSSGEGKPKDSESRVTVFKRAPDERYSLKMKASREAFSEINKRFPVFPFSMRYFEETKIKFGIKECLQHGLVKPYPVLLEKDGEFVAHVKFTALLMPNGALKVCGAGAGGVGIDLSAAKSEHQVADEALKAILATSAAKKKKKNKKKKPASSGGATGDNKPEEEDDDAEDE